MNSTFRFWRKTYIFRWFYSPDIDTTFARSRQTCIFWTHFKEIEWFLTQGIATTSTRSRQNCVFGQSAHDISHSPKPHIRNIGTILCPHTLTVHLCANNEFNVFSTSRRITPLEQRWRSQRPLPEVLALTGIWFLFVRANTLVAMASAPLVRGGALALTKCYRTKSYLSWKVAASSSNWLTASFLHLAPLGRFVIQWSVALRFARQSMSSIVVLRNRSWCRNRTARIYKSTESWCCSRRYVLSTGSIYACHQTWKFERTSTLVFLTTWTCLRYQSLSAASSWSLFVKKNELKNVLTLFL